MSCGSCTGLVYRGGAFAPPKGGAARRTKKHTRKSHKKGKKGTRKIRSGLSLRPSRKIKKH